MCFTRAVVVFGRRSIELLLFVRNKKIMHETEPERQKKDTKRAREKHCDTLYSLRMIKSHLVKSFLKIFIHPTSTE